MLKEKVIGSSNRQNLLSKEAGKLRSSIDFLTSDRRFQQAHGNSTSLSQSCNFAERSSLQTNQKMFKKSGNRSNLTSYLGENTSPNMLKTTDRHCQNHQAKQAQFEVATEGDVMYYCERCAISLASQGFNVCRVEVGTQSLKAGFRPIEIDFLLEHIELIRQTLNKEYNSARKQQQSNRQLMGKLEQDVNNYFRTVEDTLANIKKSTLKEFQREKQRYLSNEPQCQDVYTDAIKNLDFIVNEIRHEQHNAQHLRSSDYKQRLSSYRSRLEIYKKILSETSISDAKPQIKFPPTNSLADDLTNMLRVEFNLMPKSHLFSFCKAQNLKAKESSRPISQFDSDFS